MSNEKKTAKIDSPASSRVGIYLVLFLGLQFAGMHT